jgi:conjugative transposon TraN protein
MKNQFKSFWTFVLLITIVLPCFAQENTETRLDLAKIEPYLMEVTYDKTSHLIFPAAIVYVDLGSVNLVAAKAEDAQNVLRVKAAVKDFETETNFSVITNDGHFYSFNVHYSTCPEIMSYNLKTMSSTIEKANTSDVLFEELGNIKPSLSGLVMKTIYKNDKRTLKHIGSGSFGIQFSLKGLYVHSGKYFFHTQLTNSTNVPFRIDYITFKVVDKKTARRTAVQERPLLPLSIYKAQDLIDAASSDRNIFLLDQFTLEDDKILLIEIFEKNGGRHQTLRVKNSDLIKARLINDINLQF